MYLTFFFLHPNHRSSFFMEHVETASPCSSPQSSLSTYAKCYYCSSFRSDLKRGIVCSKELQAVRCGLFIVTDLKYTSDGKYIPAVYCVTEPTGSLPLPPAPSEYSLYYSRTFRDSACKFDLAVNFRLNYMWWRLSTLCDRTVSLAPVLSGLYLLYVRIKDLYNNRILKLRGFLKNHLAYRPCFIDEETESHKCYTIFPRPQIQLEAGSKWKCADRLTSRPKSPLDPSTHTFQCCL